MYFANNIVLLEMPKAGSTFMRRFLDNYFGRENTTKKGVHNGVNNKKLRKHIINGELIAISTIRNPYDWYGSIFAWNAMGKGIYRDIGFRRYEFSSEGLKSVLKNPFILGRDISKWDEVFRNYQSKEAFQKYLGLMLEEKSHHINYKYGKLNDIIGFCTYRFLEISTYKFGSNYKQLLNKVNPKEYYDNNLLPINFLKLENIEDELLDKSYKFGLMPEKVKKVLSEMNSNGKKYNSSKNKPDEFILDENYKDLIKSKDSLIFELFGYQK